MSLLDESLRAVLRDVVREELARALGTRPSAPATGVTMLSRRQLAAALQLSARTVSRLDAEGLPGTGKGRLRRYDLEAVRRWLDDRGKPTNVVDLHQRAAELLARGRR